MPKYGTSIDMKHFGSEFDGGYLKKRNAEQSIRFLQGKKQFNIICLYPTINDKSCLNLGIKIPMLNAFM